MCLGCFYSRQFCWGSSSSLQTHKLGPRGRREGSSHSLDRWGNLVFKLLFFEVVLCSISLMIWLHSDSCRQDQYSWKAASWRFLWCQMDFLHSTGRVFWGAWRSILWSIRWSQCDQHIFWEKTLPEGIWLAAESREPIYHLGRGYFGSQLWATWSKWGKGTCCRWGRGCGRGVWWWSWSGWDRLDLEGGFRSKDFVTYNYYLFLNKKI